MQFLVVDVGNTSTAVGLWSSGHVRCVAHCDEGFNQASLVAQELVQKKGFRLSGLAYLSVVPRQNARWKRWAHALKMPFLPITSRLFTEHVYSDLTLDYPHPETIGCDRLADAAAALDRYGAPVLVCDFGTAWTSAVMTSDGVWRGGVIAPGFPLMRDYLFERTAQLPRMKLGYGRCPPIGRSTEEAMRFGAQVGFRGMVREIVTQLKENFQTDFRLVATGGFARWVLRGSGMDFHIDPTLTLHGAGLVASVALQKGFQFL